MRLLIIGTGYVGLVTGTCFAEMGHTVTCLDIDHKKISTLRNGQVPIYEPGLHELLVRNMASGRLHFTTDYNNVVDEAEICFIAVATPTSATGNADLQYVFQAASQIAEHMNSPKLIVNKSTVPVGTSTSVRSVIEASLKKRNVSVDFEVVSNPEFLKEGDAIKDFMQPDRVVIGVTSERAKAQMTQLYEPFSLQGDRLLIMDVPSAEMTKYAANAMLAARISFMNEIALLCEQTGADIDSVRIGIGSDTRIGSSFLQAGAGYGGSCFPKDVKALQAAFKTKGLPSDILNAIESVNERQKCLIGNKIQHFFQKNLKNRTIAIWGLSFKPNTDDMRQAPALVTIAQLAKSACCLRVFDPVAMPNAAIYLKDIPNLTFCTSEIEAASGADAIAIITEWPQFRFVDLEAVKDVMRSPIIFDGRNQHRPEKMAQLGFTYISIGRKAQSNICVMV